jgi:alpha-tubulin suppressor-like RCC1 family protein
VACTDGLVERNGACVEAQLLASGNSHTCVVHDGGVACWGPGSTGVLGRGGYDGGRSPGYAALVDVGSVTAGDNSTCALLLDAGVRCWGSNMFGAVGNSGTLDQFTPAVVSLGSARALVSGSMHVCALLGDAGAACWGSNLLGAIGGGAALGQVVRAPVAVPGAWVRLAAGDLESFGLGADGGVSFWGSDLVLNSASTPTSVGWDAGLRALVRSATHGCLIGADGALRCFGRGLEGQLGFVETTTQDRPLRVVPGLGRVGSVCVGDKYTCAAVVDGGVSCFGDNTWGQLGTGNLTASSSPQAVVGLSAAAQVSCHLHSTCATTVTGVFCWGDNALGQLGAPTPASSPTPVPVTLP